MIEIRHRRTETVLWTVEGETLRGADLGDADLGGADLYGADLYGADLTGADLRGADLGGAHLRGAELRGAFLCGAELDGARLRGAYLRGAYLRGARGWWHSHDVIAELLRRAAGDDPHRRAYAGLVLVSRDWCWGVWKSRMRESAPELSEWARRVLADAADPEDPTIPDGFLASAERHLAKMRATNEGGAR